MSLRSFITVLVVLGLVGLGLWVAWLNPERVTLRLPGVPPLDTRLWVVAFLSLLAGVVVALVYSVVSSSRQALTEWRSRRDQQRAAEAGAIFQRGVRAALRGRHREALGHFEKVLERDPDHLDAWLHGGDAARGVGELDRAVDMHLRARGLAPDEPRVQEALAADFEALGEYGRAIKYLQQRVAGDPKGDAGACGWLRDLLMREGRWEEAAAAQEQRLKLLAEPGARAEEEAVLRGLRLERGRALLEEGKHEEAAALFASLAKAHPDLVPAHLLLAQARLAAGDADGAVRAWRDGFKATGSLELLDRLVRHHLESEAPDAAIGAYREAVEQLEADKGLAARLGLAELYYRLEMPEEAEAEFEALEEYTEFSPALRYYLGKLRQRRGDDRTAARLFEEVIEAAGLLGVRHRCGHCGATYGEYAVRCSGCGRWGTVEVDVSHELRPAQELGLRVPRL